MYSGSKEMEMLSLFKEKMCQENFDFEDATLSVHAIERGESTKIAYLKQLEDLKSMVQNL